MARSWITLDRKRACCPVCHRQFRLKDKYFIPRHGFKFEKDSGVYQSIRGNHQHGRCSGSGAEMPHELIDVEA